MKRIAILLALVVTLASTDWAVDPALQADTSRPRGMVVVIADGAAVRQSDQGASFTNSFIALVAALRSDHLFTFISADDPANVMGPIAASDAEFEATQDEFEAGLLSPQLDERWGIADAITAAELVLGGERASPGSTLYIMRGGSTDQADFEELSRRLSTMAKRFGDKGWAIDGVGLPDASPAAVEFVEYLSTLSGGQVFELSVSDGFPRLADAILSQGAKGSLSPVSKRQMESNELVTSLISVAPGTRETTLLIFKESPYGSLRLSNPSGFEVSAGDRTESSVIETTHVVVWRLVDPAPGNWKVDIRGMEGLLSAWEYTSNKYSLVLSPTTPLPMNEPNTLVAFVMEDERPVALEGVRLFANITTPDGTRLSHEMRDDGLGVDNKAGDGYFSATVSPLVAEGEYSVDLELTWLAYNHRISSRGVFEARAFPAVEVQTESIDDLVPGERTKVATVFVHIQGGPYPVTPDMLAATVAAPGGDEGTVELVPRRLFGDGPAWEYDAYLTTEVEGSHTLVFMLSLDYAGTRYSHLSDSLVVAAAIPSVPAPPEIEASVVEPVAPPTPALAPGATPVQTVPQFGPRAGRSDFTWWWMMAIPASLILAVAAVVVYLLTRTRPYGYIYNDRDEPLVDFSEVKRHPVWSLIFRGLVRGRELDLPGLESVVFHFKANRVRLRVRKQEQTIRVDNQPLIGEATIGDRTWIGTTGKLYTFLVSPSSSPEAAGAD